MDDTFSFKKICSKKGEDDIKTSLCAFTSSLSLVIIKQSLYTDRDRIMYKTLYNVKGMKGDKY